MTQSLPSIGFLGLGAMGQRMAARLLSAGHRVTVWNRSAGATANLAALGALTAPDPASAAREADIVIAMVRDDDASRQVWLASGTGAMAAMRPGAIAVECSTLSVDAARHLADEAAKAGLGWLDAPVAGSRPQAEAGQLVFMVGGAETVLSEARATLGAMGSAVHHAGGAGAGSAVKLAVNALLAVQVTALAELLGLLARNGVDLATGVSIVGETPVASPALRAAAASMLAGAFAPLFPVELVEKDLNYADRAAGGLAPLTQAAGAVMRSTMEAGWANAHITAAAQLYRANAQDPTVDR
ncbi:NAD(P)-dependent oxidoreductase [Novosphingobium sp.]|uniref:NAD(P)-dependent oxidoreductase n=1 Tax=Novosphingobium sp. TaxID=1874826 RepID=UPI002630CD73|nr:NAD(P)-dependent oxidoreductase [Novosphingobium sp.]